MLNSHFSSLSLAGVRRACPALKPDAADQVLLKNRAGFAAFSKGRAFHHVGNRIAARVTGRRGPAGPCPAHYGQKRAAGAIRWIGRTGQAALQRGWPYGGGDAGSTRRLSETYSTGCQPGPQDSPGVFSLSEGLRPSRCRRAIRAGRTHGPCVPTAGVAVARAVRAEAWAMPGIRGWADGLRPWVHTGGSTDPLVPGCGGICPAGHITFNAFALPLFLRACRVLNVLFAAFRLWAAV